MHNQTEKVNIRPKSYLPVFRVSEGDVGRTLTAHLVSDDGDVTIPAGATVTMAGTKPSGLGYTVAGTVDGSDVSFDTDAVMTDEPGRIVSEIRIVQGDTVIGTTNVVLSVEPNPHPDDTTDGRREPLVNEITALLTSITEQADRVQEYSGKVLNMTVSAHESDEVTVTKTEGEVVNLDFGLPRGPQGETGPQGPHGETGPQGPKGDPGEVSLETLAKVMVSDTASGTIANFTDGSDVLPAKSVLVTLEPIQDLHGYDKPWVGGAGVNLIDSDYAIKFTLNKTITLPKTISANSRIHIHSDGYSYTTPPSSGLKYPYYVFRDADGNNCGAVWGYRDSWLTLSADAVVVQLWSNGYDYAASTGVEVTINGVTISLEEQSSWTPYSNICPISGHDSVSAVVSPTTTASDGHTYTTDLPQTVYGGTVDVVSGVLTVTHGYISQYNGETINEPWISDRDEYVAGTTPTTGAQVVYELATPQTIQCDPQTVQTLIGDNNVWGGSGVVVDYYADTKLYIEKMLGA